MLWTEGLSAPLRSKIELHSHEIAEFAVNAIANQASEFLFRAAPPDDSARRKRAFELEASSGIRYVLQHGLGSMTFAGSIFPANLQQIRAQHANFRSPFLHKLLIGSRDRKPYPLILNWIGTPLDGHPRIVA